MKTLRAFLVLVLSVLAFSWAPPSEATHTVGVTLRLSYGRSDANRRVCSNLNVSSGSDHIVDGLEVLQAATDAHCISGYITSGDDTSGHFVESIDGLSGAPAAALRIVYWEMRVNGACSEVGVDDYAASPGDVLWFAYNSWATWDTPAGCP